MMPMITAIVLYNLPETIGLEECRAHFTSIAPGFLRSAGISSESNSSAGRTAASLAASICGKARPRPRHSTVALGATGFARYGNDPTIQYFETVALTDKAAGIAGALD